MIYQRGSNCIQSIENSAIGYLLAAEYVEIFIQLHQSGTKVLSDCSINALSRYSHVTCGDSGFACAICPSGYITQTLPVA